MLERLHISNYALIDNVDIEFAPGFNAVTGETGAGKSIMLGALSLLLGGRADGGIVRDKERRSVIEAVFTGVGNYPGLKDYFETNDLDWDDERCVLRREVSVSGSSRSRAFINDTPVTVGKLQEVALQLVDLHSQHQNQLLSQPTFQLEVIDSIARNATERKDYQEKYRALKSAMVRYKRKQRQVEVAKGEEEYLRYRYERLETMNLIEGEQEQLEQERLRLSNVETLRSHLGDSFTLLSGSEGDGLLSQLETLKQHLETAEAALPSDDRINDRLESVSIELQDITSTIEGALEGLEADPRRLEVIEERLSDLYDLERKHGVDNVEALIKLRDDLREKLSVIDNSDVELGKLKREAKHALEVAKSSAQTLSATRHSAASVFGERLREIASPLGMHNLVVDIKISESELGPTGSDSVDFRFAFNKNQTPVSVGGTASGGEVSRLMLSIKSLIAKHIQLPSIIFDEIDTGVSGDVARRMGRMMAEMSGEGLQVIAITHLPQVAALADSHYKVYKEDTEETTNTHIERLDEGSRIDELSLMLSGNTENQDARATAKSLLNKKS